ncbi:septal ring lytic transglycosylase RlpA family protein [Pontibacter russatus]|uniref:septal ring lytic transglycosylase RlpA family protein n=1 Tax=Pontibacter russatus TaxID=2694929 RepID=UPI00192A2F5A|nr:septal ring lytic transglycosylase RlpA family protein [Pontibacter russatus]
MNICSILFLALFSFFNNTAPYTAEGQATYYADRMEGRATASGERYDKSLYTAAHATLPFGTRLLVRNLKNNKTVEVRVNDRQARHRLHIIDLSRAAAETIDMVRAGKASVRLEEVKNEETEQQAQPNPVSETGSAN